MAHNNQYSAMDSKLALRSGFSCPEPEQLKLKLISPATSPQLDLVAELYIKFSYRLFATAAASCSTASSELMSELKCAVTTSVIAPACAPRRAMP